MRYADAPAGAVTTAALFDTANFPIDQPDSAGYERLVGSARTGLAEHNCVVIDGMVRSSTLVAMCCEAVAQAPAATCTEAWLNPYFSTPPRDCPADHPLRRLALRRHGMIRADRFDTGGTIRAVFENSDLTRFVAACLGYETLHAWRDPYGCVNVNVQQPGRDFSWHFDHNDFTVSILLQAPDDGGVFEYAPDIRTAEDENYDEVRKVLDGDRSRVRTLELSPGNLQLFRGGNTLHRVTAPRGGTDRLCLLLSYVEDPDHMTSPEYARRLWGEVHPMQAQAAAAA